MATSANSSFTDFFIRYRIVVQVLFGKAYTIEVKLA